MKRWQTGYTHNLETKENRRFIEIYEVPEWRYWANKLLTALDKPLHKLLPNRYIDWEINWDAKYWRNTRRVIAYITEEEYQKIKDF